MPRVSLCLLPALGSGRPRAGSRSLFSTFVSASSLPFMDLCFVLGLHLSSYRWAWASEPDCNLKTALVAKLEGLAASAQRPDNPFPHPSEPICEPVMC